MAFLKIVEFVGEVLIFAINHDFKCTNAVIKTMLCFYLIFWLPYSAMLCTMYLYFSVQVSTVNHEWNDDFCACGRRMGHLFFSSFHMSFFLILCKIFLLYFTLYGIHVYIHIVAHTMEACNKDYYYYLMAVPLTFGATGDEGSLGH